MTAARPALASSLFVGIPESALFCLWLHQQDALCAVE